jgi:hypothetical protein
LSQLAILAWHASGTSADRLVQNRTMLVKETVFRGSEATPHSK